MVKLEAFLSLEGSVAGTINATMNKVTAKAVSQLLPLIEDGKWDDAHDIANRFHMNGVVGAQRRRLEELAVSALLFGAQNVTGSPASTSFVRGEQQLPWAMQQALDQLTEMVETLGGEQVRNAIHNFVRAQEIVPVEKSELRKADQALVDMLNAAVMGTGKMQVDLSANLTTSRLVSLGFLAEAAEKSVTTYQVNEVLDSRTCPVCQYMHGKTFSVEQEYNRVLTALGTSDPKELKAIAPWPSSSKAGLRDLNGMSLSDMQAAGYGSPPYHPLCRGVLVMTGTITEQIPLGGLGEIGKKIVQQLVTDAADEPVTVPVATTVTSYTLSMVTDDTLRELIGQITSRTRRRSAIRAFVEGDIAQVYTILADAGVDAPSP